MDNVNEFRIVGKIDRDLELKKSAKGNAYTRLNLEYKTNTKTSWFSMTLFGKEAEELCKFYAQGDVVDIRGKLKMGKNMEGKSQLELEPITIQKIAAVSAANESNMDVPF